MRYSSYFVCVNLCGFLAMLLEGHGERKLLLSNNISNKHNILLISADIALLYCISASVLHLNLKRDSLAALAAESMNTAATAEGMKRPLRRDVIISSGDQLLA